MNAGLVPRLLRSPHGATAVEFALLAPTFLMFLFLLLDGGRMMFTKQSLNELATATARCMATKQGACADTASAQTWAVNRGLTRNNLQLASSNVTINTDATCGGISNMIQATITMPWKKGGMMLLPQSVAPASLTATACFPTIT
jgi:Flp pilus assembly protein TadG